MCISVLQSLSNTKVSRIFFYGLTAAYVSLLLLYLILSHYRHFIVVGILIGLYFLRHSSYVLNHPKLQPIAACSPIAEIVLLFLVFLRSSTKIESIVFVIIAADILLNYKSWYALPFAYIGFIVYLFLWPEDERDVWQHIFYLLSYTCLVLPIWSTKLLLNGRDMNLRLNRALVQEAKMREELAVFKERARIAEEVHDTVGHTLTTSIVALEGASLLFDVKPEEALRKIRVAREQLKEGLGNIRQVARALKAEGGNEKRGLRENIEKMMRDTSEHTGVQFEFHSGIGTPLIPLQEYVLVNAIKESITNALKHGRGDQIKITILGREQ
ncbi:sensor histidine kinase [Paenibacillus sp. CAU 1782]